MKKTERTTILSESQTTAIALDGQPCPIKWVDSTYPKRMARTAHAKQQLDKLEFQELKIRTTEDHGASSLPTPPVADSAASRPDIVTPPGMFWHVVGILLSLSDLYRLHFTFLVYTAHSHHVFTNESR